MDINKALEREYLKAASATSSQMKLPRPIPKLCTLVTASPVDAALHDAFGKLHGRNSFSVCGKEFVHYDLSHYLNAEFRGEYLDRYILQRPTPRIRIYHSVALRIRRRKRTCTNRSEMDCPKRRRSGFRTAESRPSRSS